MENAQHKTFLINSFLNVRKKTMELIKNLNPEDMVIQTEPFVSPIKWHLAHTTWFFENFVLKNFKNYLVCFLYDIYTILKNFSFNKKITKNTSGYIDAAIHSNAYVLELPYYYCVIFSKIVLLFTFKFSLR